jgi:nicotinate phosphoribosyltransferase
MKREQQKIAEGILFTDEYQLTMAQLYFRMGIHEQSAQFDHFFRSYPDYGNHQAGYCINAGLEWLLEWMEEARFGETEIDLLRQQRGSTGKQMFQEDFLTWLQTKFSFDLLQMQAIPEGRVVHPNVPLTVVQGPLAVAQILETSLLNQLNYQTLIATKAARINQSGNGNLLMEFGMRRGPDTGVNAGARAALIGGANYTSNVGISYVMGLPPKGTHAHSMVQVFMANGGSELEAFQAYADVYPDDCLLLVDTIDTLHSGVPNAIKVFEDLRRKGHQPVGIRLDSGDLAHLSVEAARMLDQAGFENVSIVLSNELDELVIWQITTQIRKEAARSGMNAEKVINRLVYGVGTRLITSQGQSALDGVYKLVAVCQDGQWKPAMKISENPAKIPNPGHKHAWRIYDRRGKATADLLSAEGEELDPQESILLHHPSEHGVYRRLDQSQVSKVEPLQVDILRGGRRLYPTPTLEEMRARREEDIKNLDDGVKRILNPHIYHVSLTPKLWGIKQSLIKKLEAD